MTSEYQIHEEAPTDDEGHPIHPEAGYRICGARKSDRSTPAPHGRSRDEYSYCLLRAGWGTETDVGACRNHPYKGSQIGTSNPNHKHGAYSKFMQHDLTEEEREAYQDLVDAFQDPEEALDTIRELAAEALLKYKRSGDQRFLREFRQIADTFNLAPNEDHIGVEHSGRIDGERTLGEEEQAAIREALASRRDSA